MIRTHATTNLLAGALVSFLVVLGADQVRDHVDRSLAPLNGTVPAHPAEDDPSWNCQDHGDRICGEMTP